MITLRVEIQMWQMKLEKRAGVIHRNALTVYGPKTKHVYRMLEGSAWQQDVLNKTVENLFRFLICIRPGGLVYVSLSRPSGLSEWNVSRLFTQRLE
jgi:hypothetical protein